MRNKHFVGLKFFHDFNHAITRGIAILRQLMIFKLKENVITGDQPKLERCIFRLGAPHFHERFFVYQPPMRRPAIGHNNHFDPSASLDLERDNPAATKYFIVRVRREHDGASGC